MKKLNLIGIVAFLMFSITISAQTPTKTTKLVTAAQQAVQEVKPNIIKKLPEKQQAMYDQMATDLKLSEDQKNQVITFAMERAVSLNEKMKTATTDEAKKELKLASKAEYEAKLTKALGAETTAKINEWQKEYTLKQKAAQAK